MTKILYVPTGRYLEYFTGDRLNTSVILEDVFVTLDRYIINEEIQEIVDLNTSQTKRIDCDMWITLNNIKFPISIFDFEIIYD